ncbi:uncharacterized protein EV420DRAFT_1653467 [Desarmillaria tabescens]|uniref:Uncharacterized protein n=1 Tax=Armillaria tabescens TaxID=1929756 RepID=A0AA39MI13_ARMTA|nr:uncharacterized protein EV420DRAFT_1653467 [Desarmillaria tabescens]KAK0435092.1 hypothetical protein EV420DRAFT_1653467 [Desarmillaria tabescens]
MSVPSHGYTDAKLHEQKNAINRKVPYCLGYFFGAKCSKKSLVPVPLLESVTDNATRSINDLDVRYWMDYAPFIGGRRKCDEGRKIVPLPPFMQSLKGMHAYVIYYVSSHRSCWWARNKLLQKLYPERIVKGDVLVMKLTTSQSIGDMSLVNVMEVEELLMRAVSHRWIK